jgi:hypothetical protein
MKYFLIWAGWLLSYPVFSQSAGDYRSNVASGNWNATSSWQRYNGTAWVAATTTPTSADGAIEIRSGNVIIVTANVTVDQVTVNGTLTVNSGITLSAGAAASMLTVNSGATVNNSGTIGGTASSNLFNANSLYVHDSSNSNGGVVPTATWNVASTVRIGFTGNTSYTLTSTSWSQAFGNVEINITSNGNRTNDFAGLLTTVNGNFNFIQNTQQSGSTLILSNSGTNSLTIGGNFTMTAARTLNLASAGTNTINVAGNFSLGTGGTITTTGTGNINFNGPGNIQTYSRSGTFTGAVNFSVASGSIVDAGTNTFTGTGTFTLNGELRTGSATGLNGTLVNTGTKTFNNNCTVHYNGIAAQVMGTLYPASPPSNMNVVINNTSGVTTSVTPTIVRGVLNLIQGNLNVASGHNLQIEGTLSRTSGNVSMNANANLTINGSGALGVSPFPFSSDPTFVNFTLNRTSGTVDFNNNVTLNGTATFSAGTVTFYNRQFTWSGPVSFSGGFIAGNGFSTLNIDGSGAIGTLDFASGGNLLATLNLNRSGADISLSGNLTITSVMNILIGNLNAGNHTITMQGNTWNVDNLSGGSFTPQTSTVIFDGNTTVTASSSIFFHHIQLNASRSVTFPASAVNVSGDLTFSASGTFNHSNGTILLDGGGLQNFNGGNHSFYDITCNKTGGDVQLTSGVQLINVLTVASATNFKSDGHLTLRSTGDDPDQTASIAALTGGAQVSGNVIYQRYMSGEGRIYRYMSSPISNATVSGWMDDFSITGTFLNPSTVDPNTGLNVVCGSTISPTSPSLYYYNESVSGVKDNGYVAYPGSGQNANTSPLVVGRGYAAYIRECATPTLADLTGTINQGPLSLTVSFTGSVPDPDGWNLVGNPYPSRITWDTGPGWTKTNISAIVSIRNNGSGGVFEVLDEADGLSIASGQAFWVLATGAGPALSINEDAKTANSGSFYRSTNQKNSLEILLSNGVITDKAYFKLNAKASRQFDRYDFPNQDNVLFDIGILANNRQLAVNTVDDLTCDEKIQLHMKDMANGNYYFRLNLHGVFSDMQPVLVDHYTNTKTIMVGDTAYHFSVTADKASKAPGRFEIELALPVIDQSLLVRSDRESICKDEPLFISVNNPQAFVNYFATIDGVIVSDIVQAKSGMSSVSIEVPALNLKPGQNQIIIQAANNCNSAPLTQQVTIDKLASPVAVSPPAFACRGSQAVLSASGAPADGTYYWYSTYAGETPVFEGSVFTTPAITASTAFYVSGVNAAGCEGDRIEVVVTMKDFEDAIITQHSRTRLGSNYAAGNQWYFNNQPIRGGTGQYITAVRSGTYRVDVTTGGCMTSATYDFTFTRSSDSRLMTVFPNPVEGDGILNIEISSSRVGQVQIVNSLGVALKVLKLAAVEEGVWAGVAEIGDLPPGIYYIKAVTDAGSQTVKFVRGR